MPYFSTPVPESLLRQSGSFTKFETVIHRSHQICCTAAEQIQAEFNKAMNTNIISNTIAQVPELGRVHFLAFTIPNCIPERLVALTRFAEFTLLNDDFYDIAKHEEINKINVDIQSVLNGETGPHSSESLSNMTNSKQMQAGLFLDLINIDSELAMDIMSTYSKGLELATFPPDTLKTLDDYLPVRMVNSGLDVFQAMSCFGMGIKLSPAEKQQLAELVDTAMFSTTMINDIHSWPKEIKHHIENPGSEPPFNAVGMLMRHSGCSEAEAVLRMRQRQAALQARHLELLRALEAAGPVPEHHMLYIRAAQYAASGSEFWSVYVPRYPSKEDLRQPTVVFSDGVFRYADGGDHVGATPLLHVGREEQAAAASGAAVGREVAFDSAVSDAVRAVAAKKASTTTARISEKGGICKMRNGHANGHANLDAHAKDRAKSTNGHLSTWDAVDGFKGEVSLGRKYSEASEASDASSTTVVCSDEVVMAPYRYLTSMPSKGIRDMFITALNWWLEVPESELLVVKDVVGYLHQSSLMLDDIEDGSQLRRGQPATHMIFGLGQTINSANYIFVRAFARMQTLSRINPGTIDMFLEEVENLHKGQSYDLFWKDQVECPSVDEYLMMIDNKTGGLFRLCVRLMEALATKKFPGTSSEFFVSQLSRYFQIRDDYQNLMSDQYAKEKGFAEDLDEGKISLPLIFTLQSSPNRDAIARIFKRRDPCQGNLGLEMKMFIIGEMRRTGALERTYNLLRSMQESLLGELRRLESEFGTTNASLELVLRKLWLK